MKYVGSNRPAEMRGVIDVVTSLDGVNLPETLVDHIISAGRTAGGPLDDSLPEGSVSVTAAEVNKAAKKVRADLGVSLSPETAAALIEQLGVNIEYR